MAGCELRDSKPGHPSWRFFGNWLLAGTIGWGLSYLALWAVALAVHIFVSGLGESFLFIASLPTIAAVVGVFQWLAMRGQVEHSGRWFLASILGSVLWALALQYSRGRLADLTREASAVRLFVMFLYIAGAGGLIGTLQWILVLRPNVRHGYLWVPASSLGWAVAHLEWVWDFGFGMGITAVTIRRALLGTMFGVVTGLCLLGLLRYSGRTKPGT